MNQRAMWTIVRKDLKVTLQSRPVLIPLIVVPLLILVIMPGIGGVLLAGADPESESVQDFEEESGAFFDNLPPAMEKRLAEYDNQVQEMTYVIFNMFFPAMYLLLPTMVANVMAADSFVGEKERKTLEALIHTPVTDRELYIAKLLAPWLAGIAVGVLGYFAFAVVVSLTTYSLMEGFFVVNTTWLLLIFWVAPAAAGLGLGAMVWVSSRVSTFQEAYQLGGMVVIPLVLLLFGQLGGVIYLSAGMVLGIGLVLWLLTLALIWLGARTFERGTLIARL